MYGGNEEALGANGRTMLMKSRSEAGRGGNRDLCSGRGLRMGVAGAVAFVGIMAAFGAAGLSASAIAQEAKAPPPPPPAVVQAIQSRHAPADASVLDSGAVIGNEPAIAVDAEGAVVAGEAGTGDAGAAMLEFLTSGGADVSGEESGAAALEAASSGASDAASDAATRLGESVPAARPAAADESARLAAEVPAEDVAIPAGEWLEQEVGEIATRPVVEDGASVEPLGHERTASSGTGEIVARETGESAGSVATSDAASTILTAPGAADMVVRTEDHRDRGLSDAPVAIAAPGAAAADSSAPIDGISGKSPISSGAAEAASASAGSSSDVPTIVSIKADFSERAGSMADEMTEGFVGTSRHKVVMRGPAALPDAAFGADPETRFALVWVDGTQRSGDTFVKFWQPSRVFFADGRSCLEWARNEAGEGRAIAPSGAQPGELQAVCLAGDGSGEFWIWRQRSGAFSRSVLMPSQARFFQEVIRSWSASSALAYGEFPEPPYAGQ